MLYLLIIYYFAEVLPRIRVDQQKSSIIVFESNKEMMTTLRIIPSQTIQVFSSVMDVVYKKLAQVNNMVLETDKRLSTWYP